ncbi:DUF1588 domain-containing protein [Marinagarivorans cellulosilyticus]|uniref:DUF1588 domain-containing protein n=1 Tax=Marinagarivorans cellulosilyticus TaxID=2721545 RepID=A0AAN1WKV3_9GAMM|nr:DUF1588 domain-containing protein [Marinagarivorans cellulosilyticus]BCD99444.1 hypothetical protein MARGE09_P3646 [Marinagarivorans cellulosilyticus]
MAGLYGAHISSQRCATTVLLWLLSCCLLACSGGGGEGAALQQDSAALAAPGNTPAVTPSSIAYSAPASSSGSVMSSEPVVQSSFAENASVSVSSTAVIAVSTSSGSVSSSNGADVQSPPVATWPQAWQFFDQTLVSSLVNTDCSICHVAQGMAGATPLQFAVNNNYQNAQILERYVLEADNANRLLRKITGFDGHGGGAIVNRQQQAYKDVEAWLALILPETQQVTKPAFTAIQIEPRQKTLRRAALILTGRLPTRDENDRVIRSDAELAKVLKELMQTEGFEQFLIRGANDQFLTDSFLNGQFFELSNGFAPYYPVGSNRRYFAYESGDVWPFERWNHDIYHGMVRGPLALIAHTVMNDRPYTDIVTADYTMGNQSMADYMRQDAIFEYGDKFDLQPIKNNGQILMQSGHEQYLDPSIGLRIDQHGEWVEYPHAGILNEPAFLARYPSSDTNRNRLRAKMVYRLFLGVEVEDIAARTIAGDALVDTQNPTLNNDACAVCHETLDPVAGAFQNFGVDGWYRSSWEGMDSLPSSYKHEANSPYVEGDLWYRDMRSPGFEGKAIGDSARSLAELGRYIAQDDRFAEAAVKFWWPAIMSDALLTSAAGETPLYQQQQQFIRALAQQFREGFNGQAPYNLKDLIVAMVMSDWFRAEQIAFDDSASEPVNSQGTLALSGVRLLTPEELENKVKALVGFAWGEREDFWANNGFWSYMDDQFRIYYGGIDSLGVTERAKVQNSLMANVAESQAVNLACAAVLLDVNRDTVSQRLLRNQARYVSPFSHNWQWLELAQPQSVTLSLTLLPGQNRLRISHLNAERIGPVVFDQLQVVATDGTLLFSAVHASDNIVLSHEAQKVTGLQAGSMIVLEKGYADITFEGQGYTEVQLRADVLTPIEWVEPAQVSVDVLDLAGRGGQVLRQQMVELFTLTQGSDYAVDSPEITEAMDTFIAVWQTLEMQATPMTLAQHANNYCELGAQGLPKIRDLNTSDPQRLLSAWSHMMVYFFTDFYFLHE